MLSINASCEGFSATLVMLSELLTFLTSTQSLHTAFQVTQCLLRIVINMDLDVLVKTTT